MFYFLKTHAVQIPARHVNYNMFAEVKQKTYASLVIIILLSCLLNYGTRFIHPLFSFVKYVPLLWFLKGNRNYKTVFIAVFITVAAEYMLTTYWLVSYSFTKALMLYTFIALGYGITCILIPWLERKRGDYGIYAFPVLLALVEVLNNEYFINVSLLANGNVFSRMPEIIQWYRYTGGEGGTVWIGYINVCILFACLYFRKGDKRKGICYIAGVILLMLPLTLLSLYLYGKKDSGKIIKVLSVANDRDDHLESMKNLIDSNIDGDILLLPETFFYNNALQSCMHNPDVKKMQKLVDARKLPYIIAGMDLEVPDTAGFLKGVVNGHQYRYKKYNAAVKYKIGEIEVKTKKCLIPFEEYRPAICGNMDVKTCNFSVDENNGNSFKIFDKEGLVLICYEILNSSFIAENMADKTGFIALLSSEQFIEGKTTGINQYLELIRIKAIEFQKYIVKSSDRGSAACINNKGDIVAKSAIGSNQLLTAPVINLPYKTIYCIIRPFLKYVLLFVLVLLIIRTL